MEHDIRPVFAQAEVSVEGGPLAVLIALLVVVLLVGWAVFALFQSRRHRARGRELAELAPQRGWRYQAEGDDDLEAHMRRFYLLWPGAMPRRAPGFLRKLTRSGCSRVVDVTWGNQPVRMFDYVYYERERRGGKDTKTRHHRGGAIVPVPQGLPHFWLQPRGVTRFRSPQLPPSSWRKSDTGLDVFDRRFTVLSNQPDAARQVLQSPFIDTVLALPYERWEVSRDGDALLVLAPKPWELGDYERVPELLSQVTAALHRQAGTAADDRASGTSVPGEPRGSV